MRTTLLAAAALIAASLFPDLPILYESLAKSAAIVLIAVLMIVGSALVATALRLRYELEHSLATHGEETS